MAMWNLWHGCARVSPGCANCYVYRSDARYGRDSRLVSKTKSFDLPLRTDRRGAYKIPAGETVYTCFTSDFFIEDADAWRGEAWAMMKTRSDLTFLIITKRINRFYQTLPDDWGGGYDNVAVYTTVENQAMADFRLPLLMGAPLRHKGIVCEPLLERLDLSGYLGAWTEGVVAGGESGPEARVCDYGWVLDIRNQCVAAGVPFTFKQTGYRFVKDGRFIRSRGATSTHRRAGPASAQPPGRDPIKRPAPANCGAGRMLIAFPAAFGRPGICLGCN